MSTRWKPQQPSLIRTHETKQVLSWGRVLLLGIAQGHIKVKYPTNTSINKLSKPLIQNVKTMPEWIRLNRQSKNLSPGQLGAKMGITHLVIRSWESGHSRPTDNQITSMECIFGVAALHQLSC